MPTVEYQLTELLREKLGDLRAKETLSLASEVETNTYLENLVLFALGEAETYVDRKITGTGSSSVRMFDGNGRGLIFIDDFTELTQVRVDTSDDGTYDTTLTVDTHVFALPDNEDVAKTHIELQPNRGSPLSVWPKSRRAIEVTATFGWPTLPATFARGVLQMAVNAFHQDQGNRSGRLVAAGDFDIRVPSGVVLTPDVMVALNPYKFWVAF
jgi:hypothetical protein